MAAIVGEAEPLTPESAAAEIRRIEGVHGALARRTAGLMWMIWGIVVPAIFASYALAFHALAGVSGLAFLLFPFLWIPWTALGIIATLSLWRSVALVVPFDRTLPRSHVVVTGVLVVALIVVGMGVIRATGIPIAELAWALMAIGMAAAILGFTGINANDIAERRLWIVAGALLLLTALLGSLFFGSDLGLARDGFAVISPLASALVFFGGGLFLTSRA